MHFVMEAGLTIEPHGLRNLARKRVFMKAAIIDAHGTQQVRVKDLTSAGARIAGDRSVRVGEDVILKRGTMFVAARVAWSNEAGAGLEFYRSLTPAELAANFHAVFEAAD
jgi:hypothetical protein